MTQFIPRQQAGCWRSGPLARCKSDGTCAC